MHFNRTPEHLTKGFSLIELLLVIFIVSLVYFLGFSTVQKTKEATKALSPETFKSVIRQNGIKEGTLICTKQCSKCYFRKDINTPFEPYSGKLDLKGMKVYTLDAQNMLTKEEPGQYQHEKICLHVHFYPNGSSTPLVVKKDEKIYFLPSFFGEPQEATSLEEAKRLWLKDAEKLRSSGVIY